MSKLFPFAMFANKFLQESKFVMTAAKIGEIMGKTKNPIKSAKFLKLYPKKTQDNIIKGMVGYKKRFGA